MSNQNKSENNRVITKFITAVRILDTILYELVKRTVTSPITEIERTTESWDGRKQLTFSSKPFEVGSMEARICWSFAEGSFSNVTPEEVRAVLYCGCCRDAMAVMASLLEVLLQDVCQNVKHDVEEVTFTPDNLKVNIHGTGAFGQKLRNQGTKHSMFKVKLRTEPAEFWAVDLTCYQYGWKEVSAPFHAYDDLMHATSLLEGQQHVKRKLGSEMQHLEQAVSRDPGKALLDRCLLYASKQLYELREQAQAVLGLADRQEEMEIPLASLGDRAAGVAENAVETWQAEHGEDIRADNQRRFKEAEG